MAATEPWSRAWRWGAVAAVLGVALGGFVLVKSGAVERVELATPVVADTNGRVIAASQSTDLAAAIGKNQQAIDSVRAGGAAYTQGDLSTAHRAFEAAVIASPETPQLVTTWVRFWFAKGGQRTHCRTSMPPSDCRRASGATVSIERERMAS